MDIISLIQATNLEKIIAIEEHDRQYLAIQNSRNTIYSDYISQYSHLGSLDDLRNFFLLLIVKNALISYQIAGSGELRREEFTHTLKSDFFVLWKAYLVGDTCNKRFYSLMTTSKYNKRLYNLKFGRLEKFSIFPFGPMLLYYQDMHLFQLDLAKSMKTSVFAKTIPFTVKMFGYAARIVTNTIILYPMSIGIPVDSRIRKIFLQYYGPLSDRQIFDISQNLAEQYSIPPLHLDSLLWVKRD